MLTASLVGLKQLILNRLNEVPLPELKENKQGNLVVDEKEDVDDDDDDVNDVDDDDVEDEEKSSKKYLSDSSLEMIFVYLCMLICCACVLKHDRSLRMMKFGYINLQCSNNSEKRFV